MEKQNIIKLILAIIICQLAGIVGSIFTSPNITTWYASIVKPAFNPPNWIFAPVWTTLFLLMGISLYLIIKEKQTPKIRLAEGIFAIQLILNIIWSVLFFGLNNIGAAFAEIIILWIAIAATIYYFYKISKPAAYLLVPYIAWVSFATILNYSIFMLNI